MSAKPLLKALRLRGEFAAPAAREVLPAAALGAPTAAPDALLSGHVPCSGFKSRECWILMSGVVKCYYSCFQENPELMCSFVEQNPQD